MLLDSVELVVAVRVVDPEAEDIAARTERRRRRLVGKPLLIWQERLPGQAVGGQDGLQDLVGLVEVFDHDIDAHCLERREVSYPYDLARVSRRPVGTDDFFAVVLGGVIGLRQRRDLGGVDVGLEVADEVDDRLEIRLLVAPESSWNQPARPSV